MAQAPASGAIDFTTALSSDAGPYSDMKTNPVINRPRFTVRCRG